MNEILKYPKGKVLGAKSILSVPKSPDILKKSLSDNIVEIPCLYRFPNTSSCIYSIGEVKNSRTDMNPQYSIKVEFITTYPDLKVNEKILKNLDNNLPPKFPKSEQWGIYICEVFEFPITIDRWGYIPNVIDIIDSPLMPLYTFGNHPNLSTTTTGTTDLRQPHILAPVINTIITEGKYTPVYKKIPEFFLFTITDDTAPVPVMFWSGTSIKYDPNRGLNNRELGEVWYYDVPSKEGTNAKYVTINDNIKRIKNNLSWGGNSIFTIKDAERIVKKYVFSSSPGNKDFDNFLYMKNSIAKFPGFYNNIGFSVNGSLIIGATIYPPLVFELQFKSGKPTVSDTIVFQESEIESGLDSFKNEASLLKDYLDMYKNVNIVVEGYTSAAGSLESNLQLSQRRAESVKNYLVGIGIEGDRIQAAGKGEELVPDDLKGTTDDNIIYRKTIVNYQ